MVNTTDAIFDHLIHLVFGLHPLNNRIFGVCQQFDCVHERVPETDAFPNPYAQNADIYMQNRLFTVINLIVRKCTNRINISIENI